MRTSRHGEDLIKHYEGPVRLQAFLCPAGVATIGYGSTFYENGEAVRITDSIPIERAEELLRGTLAHFEKGVSKLLDVSVTQHQFDALVSLAFNIGLANFEKSTVLKEMNQGRAEDAARAFGAWMFATKRTTPNGDPGVWKQALRGLYRRRLAEGLLSRGLDWRTMTDELVVLECEPYYNEQRGEWVDKPIRKTEWREALAIARAVGELPPAPPRSDGAPAPVGTAPISPDTRAIDDVPYGLDPALGAKPMHESQRFWGQVFIAVGSAMRALGARLGATSAVLGAGVAGFGDALMMPAVQATIVLFGTWALGAIVERLGWRQKEIGERAARQVIY